MKGGDQDEEIHAPPNRPLLLRRAYKVPGTTVNCLIHRARNGRQESRPFSYLAKERLSKMLG